MAPRHSLKMIVTNEFTRDPRVCRSAITAENAGYDVSVHCIVDHFNREYEFISKIKVYRYINTIFPSIFCRISSKFIKALSVRGMQGNNANSEVGLIGKRIPNYLNRLLILIWESGIFFKLLILNYKVFVLCKKDKADIYHVHDLDTLLSGYLLARHHSSNLIYDSHELYVEQLPETYPILRKYFFIYEKFLIKKADIVITINQSIADQLSRRYHINPPEIIMNCPFYQKSGNPEKQSSFVKIIYQGIFAPGRGLEETIIAAKCFENAKLYLRGYGILENKLKTLVSKNALEEKVIFLPPVDMNSLIQSLDTFDIGIISYRSTLLNNYLALPNKIFEYMMGGCAIAACDIPEIKNVINTCQNGVLFNPDDPENICIEINSLTNNPDLLGKMKKNSILWAKNYYNWEIQGESLVKIYNGLSGME
jgi:glycosyltransferase involved in cell wall biosynthesis